MQIMGLAIFLIFMIVCTCVSAQRISPADSVAIAAKIGDWNKGWKTKDYKITTKWYSDAAEFTNAFGHTKTGRSEIEKFMKEVFEGDPGKGFLDSRVPEQAKRYAYLKDRYHEKIRQWQSDGKLDALYIGVQCEHCHGNRNGHPGTASAGTKGPVKKSACLQCHKPPFDDSFDFAARIKQVSCPRIKAAAPRLSN